VDIPHPARDIDAKHAVPATTSAGESLAERKFDALNHNVDLRRRVVAITLWFWFLHYVVLTIGSTLAKLPKPLELATGRLVWIAAGLLICRVVFFILQWLQARAFWVQVSLMILLGIPAGVLQVLLNRWILFVLYDWPPGAEAQEIYGAATYWIWFYLAWAAAALAAIYSDRVRAEQRIRAKAQELAHQAQLRTLRYQLNPHFLFNTLNSVAALVLDNQPETAEQMIRKLAAFLRSGLDSDPLQDITLRDELDQQLTYLDIERTRFPDRLHVEVQVPDDLKEARVPGFILQPLIENAVKHVVALSAEVTTITIGARAASGRLILSVEDNGPNLGATNAEPRGVGLRNTAERLAARFGSEHNFHAGLVEPRGFRVELEMPLRTNPA
jgi:hypothetical protein